MAIRPRALHLVRLGTQKCCREAFQTRSTNWNKLHGPGMQRTLTTSRLFPALRQNPKSCAVSRRASFLPPRQYLQAMSTSSASKEALITPLRETDFDNWAKLFRAYIDFYKSSIPPEQYRHTFARLIDPTKDLYGLALRDPEDESKLLAFAHFYPHQTPWSEKQIMHLNDLFTDPNVRGKGYGRKMIQAVSEEAKKLGCFRVEWATQHHNPARKLYDQMATCDFVEYRIKLSDS